VELAKLKPVILLITAHFLKGSAYQFAIKVLTLIALADKKWLSFVKTNYFVGIQEMNQVNVLILALRMFNLIAFVDILPK